MGLPGSGKSTLAKHLKMLFEKNNMNIHWLNADEVRKEYDDWDFSERGRIRQAIRMRQLSNHHKNCICDFVAPLQEMRNIFCADYTIWMNTISNSRYTDTDSIFEIPQFYNIEIRDKNADEWSKRVFDDLMRII